VALRDRLRKLQKAAERDAISVRLRGGRTARFYQDELGPDLFLHEWDRGGRHFTGEDPGPRIRLSRPSDTRRPGRSSAWSRRRGR
jgi:hypothetical protein